MGLARLKDEVEGTYPILRAANDNAAVAYDALARRTGITFSDTSTQTYGYDAADRLISQSHGFPNGTSANVSFSYGYDAAGRITSKASSNPA